MKSICASLEESLLNRLRALEPRLPAIGLLEQAAAGSLKTEELSTVQVRVYSVQQPHEAMPMFTVSAEVRLVVEQAESANAELFVSAYENIALDFESLMLDDNCIEVEPDDVFVDGLQLMGGDLDFDTSLGAWYAVWNMTLTGRLKQRKENEK